jgi:hypothetical protein
LKTEEEEEEEEEEEVVVVVVAVVVEVAEVVELRFVYGYVHPTNGDHRGAGESADFRKTSGRFPSGYQSRFSGSFRHGYKWYHTLRKLLQATTCSHP